MNPQPTQFSQRPPPAPPTTPQPPHPGPDTAREVVAFLKDRSYPCPRCAYDLRNAPAAVCPECGEPLILKIGSPRARFGWLILAMAPGCFSGVAACFVMIPIAGAMYQGVSAGNVFPWPIIVADIFGFVSAASLPIIYHYRQQLMHQPPKRQAAFALGVWGVHILMFIVLLVCMSLYA